MKCSAQSLVLLGSLLALRRRRRNARATGVVTPRISTHATHQRRSRLLLGAASIRCNQAKGRVLKRPREIVGRRCWVRPIFEDHELYGAWFTLIPTMKATDPDQFYDFFRMTPESFDILEEMVSPHLVKRSWRKSVCAGERLAITLRYIASGDRQKSLSYLFRVSPQCIANIIFETATVIATSLEKVVFERPSRDMWLRAAAEFQSMWNIHHCIGAIDGKHVVTRAFAHGGSRYFNYKGTHSLILMAVADAKYRFTMVDFGASGRRGDANVIHNSVMGRKLKNNRLRIPNACPAPGVTGDLPFVIVGDAAFNGVEGILTPFKGSFLPLEEALFNYRQSRARRVVENAFGILVGRFQVLSSAMYASKAVVKSVTLCCIALHNWHLQNEESVPPKQRRYRTEGYADYVTADGKYIYGRWRNEQPAKEEAFFHKLKVRTSASTDRKFHDENIKDKFVEYFVSNPVHWQWKKIGLC